MNNLILTTKGKLKIKQYIEICKKKKKRILELGLDTAEKTKIRSLTDIYIELNVDPYVIDAEGVTYSFYITDHICEKLSLTLNIDYVKGINIDYVKGINIDYLKSISIGVREKTKMVNTNIGMIPVEDYLEIVSAQYGFDSYEDLKKAGYNIAI